MLYVVEADTSPHAIGVHVMTHALPAVCVQEYSYICTHWQQAHYLTCVVADTYSDCSHTRKCCVWPNSCSHAYLVAKPLDSTALHCDMAAHHGHHNTVPTACM